MQDQLKMMLKEYRKRDRETLELRKLRQTVERQKSPDPKVLKMIDDEIANLNKGDLTK